MPKAIKLTRTAMTQSTAMPALLLTRTAGSGAGFRSNPLGDSIAAVAGAGELLAGVERSTSDLHGLGFFPRPEHEPGPVEQAVNDVHVALYPVIHHLGLAVRAKHDENRGLAMLNARGHL